MQGGSRLHYTGNSAGLQSTLASVLDLDNLRAAREKDCSEVVGLGLEGAGRAHNHLLEELFLQVVEMDSLVHNPVSVLPGHSVAGRLKKLAAGYTVRHRHDRQSVSRKSTLQAPAGHA
jgi:hypothetical protein